MKNPNGRRTVQTTTVKADRVRRRVTSRRPDADGRASAEPTAQTAFAAVDSRAGSHVDSGSQRQHHVRSGMQNAINEGLRSQAAAPIGEINKLMSVIVGPC